MVKRTSRHGAPSSQVALISAITTFRSLDNLGMDMKTNSAFLPLVFALAVCLSACGGTGNAPSLTSIFSVKECAATFSASSNVAFGEAQVSVLPAPIPASVQVAAPTPHQTFALSYNAAPADNPMKGFMSYQGAYSFPHSLDYPNQDRPLPGFGDGSFAYETLGPTGWHFWPRITMAGLRNIWNNPTCAPAGQELDLSIKTTRASWLLNNSLFAGTFSAQQRQLATEAARSMGYTLHISQATVESSAAGQALRGTVARENRGVAPFDHPWTGMAGRDKRSLPNVDINL